MFHFLRKHRPNYRRAQGWYEDCMTQSRDSAFYEKLGVPDTIDGRFDLLGLHCAITMLRLRHSTPAGQAKKMRQALFDTMFHHMDRTLREIGIGDLAVPKHMKRMMQGFNGRLRHYASAMDEGDMAELAIALRRNVYGTLDDQSIDNKALNHLAEYVHKNAQAGLDVAADHVFFTSLQETIGNDAASNKDINEENHAA